MGTRTLQQRGKSKTWWVRFTAPDGREIYRSARTTSRREAQEYLDKLRAQLWRQGVLGEPAPVLWDEAVADWAEAHAHKRSIGKDRANLRWLHPHLAGVPLREITADRVREIARIRAAEPADKRRRTRADAAPIADTPTSAATVNRMLALVRSILRHAHQGKKLESVPTIALAEERKAEPVPLSRDQVRALLAEIPAHLRAPLALALATGLREQNVLRLEWARVDLERRVAWISNTATKNRRTLAIALSPDAVAILEAQRGRNARWVFPSPRGTGPLTRASNTGWYAARERAGVRARWHDLRHTWASWQAMAGASLRDLMELGGWTSQAMALRYTHLNADHLQQAASRVSLGPDLLGQIPGKSGEEPSSSSASG
jgi:integrase